MEIARSCYRKLFPLKIRQFVWFLRNLISHIFSDRLPEKWSFDYENYWVERVKNVQDGVSYPEILGICSQLISHDASVLDIGCGSGQFLKQLSDLIPIQAVGIDISIKAVEIAKKRGIDAFIRNAGKDKLSELGDFEFITMFEVLEHINNAEEVLLNISKTFQHSMIILSIPNTGYIFSRMRLLFGRFPRQWIIHPSEHLRFWTQHDFKITAQGLGYKILNIIPVRGPSSLAKWRSSLFAEVLIFVLKTK